MSETKISLLSHFKNLFLVGFFNLAANSLISEVSQIILKSFSISDFYLANQFLIQIIVSILVGWLIFSWFGNYLFETKFDKIRANNLILRYVIITTIIYSLFIFIGLSLILPGIEIEDSLSLTFKVFCINLVLILFIWKYFDYQIKNETKLTEK